MQMLGDGSEVNACCNSVCPRFALMKPEEQGTQYLYLGGLLTEWPPARALIWTFTRACPTKALKVNLH